MFLQAYLEKIVEYLGLNPFQIERLDCAHITDHFEM